MGRSSSLLAEEAEEYCTLGRGESERMGNVDGEANGDCHG